MPEERGLYPRMKVGEQLVYLARLHGLSPAAGDRGAVAEWTERLGVAERIDDEVQKLSLGNQQRVQLAAALVHDPELLVLDEPFSGLDPLAVDVMSDVLRDRPARAACRSSSPATSSTWSSGCATGSASSGRARLVASGSVDELRAGGPSQLVVDVPQAAPGLGRRRCPG